MDRSICRVKLLFADNLTAGSSGEQPYFFRSASIRS